MDTDRTPDGGPPIDNRFPPDLCHRQCRLARRLARCARRSLPRWPKRYDCPPEHISFIESAWPRCDGRAVSLGEVFQPFKRRSLPLRLLRILGARHQTPGEGGDMHFAFSFAAQAAEVEVNTLTGIVRVLRVISANDVGKAINRLSARSGRRRCDDGIGHALTENFIVEQGRVFTDRLARYRIPSITHTPQITSSSWNTRSQPAHTAPRVSVRSSASPPRPPSPMPSIMHWRARRPPAGRPGRAGPPALPKPER